MGDKKMIVFAPHPDDETLACGGTIIKKIHEEYDVYVVLMTDGRHSHDLALGLKEPSPQEIAKIRAAEFKEAVKTLGIPPSNLILLGFEDNNLRPNIEEAKKKIAQILGRIHPVEVYVPYRNDGNEDHIAAYEIVTDSVKEAGLKATVYEYPVWNMEAPRSGLRVHTMDIGNELKRKMEAISKYRSQISVCFPKQEKAILSKDFLKTLSSRSEVFFKDEQS